MFKVKCWGVNYKISQNNISGIVEIICYRAVFAVDKLNEGWDVLNLFDIVRLYETRDGKNGKPGSGTIWEAQLIGRGGEDVVLEEILSDKSVETHSITMTFREIADINYSTVNRAL